MKTLLRYLKQMFSSSRTCPRCYGDMYLYEPGNGLMLSPGQDRGYFVCSHCRIRLNLPSHPGL